MDLAPLDCRILFEIDRNARRSMSAIAKSLRISRERLDYRVAKLMERKVITGFCATINPHQLGYQMFKVYARLRQSSERIARLRSVLANHPRLAWVATCNGSWDIVFCLYAEDADQFYRLVMKTFSQFDDIVLQFTCLVMTQVKMYERGYLTAHTKGFVPLFGRRGYVTLTELDVAIVRQLAADAWTTNLALATSTGTTSRTIAARIEALEQAGIITGYRAEVNLERLGLLFFKTRIELDQFDMDQLKEFERFCDRHPFITCFSSQVGDCILEVEMHVSSYQEYEATIGEIRTDFRRLVRTYQTLLLSDCTYRWLPSDLGSAPKIAASAVKH